MSLQKIADEIKSLKLHPATSEEYDAGYQAARYDAWLVVQGADDDATGPNLSAEVEGYKHILHASDGHKTVVIDGSEEHPFGDEFEEGDVIESIPLYRARTVAQEASEKLSAQIADLLAKAPPDFADKSRHVEWGGDAFVFLETLLSTPHTPTGE